MEQVNNSSQLEKEGVKEILAGFLKRTENLAILLVQGCRAEKQENG
jgi:hypothetical protein